MKNFSMCAKILWSEKNLMMICGVSLIGAHHPQVGGSISLFPQSSDRPLPEGGPAKATRVQSSNQRSGDHVMMVM